MQQHRSGVPHDGRQPPDSAMPGGHHDADADPGHRREQRVREWTEDAAQHEKRSGRSQAAVAEVRAAGVGAGEVQDVLGEGEADTNQPGVHQTVDDSVDHLASRPEQEQHEGALARLFRERRGEERGPGLARVGDQQVDRLQHQGPGRRHECTPAEREHEQPGRLGLVAVEPQVAGDDGTDRNRGEHESQRDRARVPGGEEYDGHDEGTKDQPDAHHNAEKHAAHTRADPQRRRYGRRHREGTRRLTSRRPAHGPSVSRAVVGEPPPKTCRPYSGTVSEQDALSETSAAEKRQQSGAGTTNYDTPVPEAYAAFMRTGWGDRELDVPPHPVAAWTPERRERIAKQFPGERLVVPAGGFKVRANDTDYRFRPDTAHTHLSGNQTSDAVLVIDDGEPVLYARPRSSRETDEFFRDRAYGELWAGRRPSLREMSDSLGLECRHLDDLPTALTTGAKTRVLRGVDSRVDALVPADEARDTELATVLSELRLVKDEWEVGQLQEACDTTTLGFEDSIREWDRVLQYGERWIEGTFFRRARAMGNDIGYDSIVGGGRHATTLHWIDNTGPVTPGELLLLDMGAEATSLYTADVTRTIPVDGRYTSLQRDLYTLVLTAQQAGIDAVRPGVPFTAPHQAAMH